MAARQLGPIAQARHLNTSRWTLQRLRNGKHKPDLDLALRMADLAGVDVSELFPADAHPPAAAA